MFVYRATLSVEQPLGTLKYLKLPCRVRCERNRLDYTRIMSQMPTQIRAAVEASISESY